MEACFYIRFSPEAKIDYNYDLVVVTEREQFIVPIYCVGKTAMIDFPDTLDFGNCPVKYMTEKPVIIRNLGEKTTKWFLTLPQGFDADKKEGVLEYGKNEQICIRFFPVEAKTYKSEAILAYDKLQAYVPIMGIAHNSNVYLSKSFIQMDDAYIGLQTQQTLQIINKSSVKVDFEWRAFATEKEEQEKKNRLRLQLQQEEDEEKMLLKEIVNNQAIQEEFEIEDHDDSDDDQRDEKAILLKRQKKAELMLERKYKNIKKAIEDDLLLFQDDIFSIEPQQGQIWPNSEMTITITFIPKGALHYSCVAYCNISCSEERLALTLAGEGIGPKAMLSQNELPIGNKFVNEVFETTITFENRGEIECRYERLPNERIFGKMFTFENDSGTLLVGKRKPITVRFQSSIPGEFKETFRFRLEGSTDLETLLCSGHVIPPAFNFNTELIDFKEVSYRFTAVKKIELTNESTVDFKFKLRIPGDDKLTEKEFEINPARASIKKKETKVIEVKFTPRSAKKYETVLVLDIEGVGQDMCSLPIKAECQVPVVEIKPRDTLDFGNIFLRDPDTRGITLINNSKHLNAKFEVLPQNEESNVLATYNVDQDRGEIQAGKEVTIRVTLVTNKLREITLPLQINIVGANNGIPYIINILANSIGPIVKVGNDLKELDFGTVDVLTDYSQKVTIKNNSKIEADFHAFTKNKISIFKPIQKHGILSPGESMDVEVICCCDDANKFSDILHFVIKEGLDIDIVLKAKGRGSTIFCKEDLENVNFNTQYTHRQTTREIFVENKGRKPQKLVWQRKPLDKKSRAIEQDKKGKDKNKDVSEEEPEIFNILPETVVLPPKHGIMYQFRANSTKRGKINEIFFLNSTIGNERKTNTLYTTTVEGEFIQPTLVFSEKKLHFKYSWEKNVPFSHISKNLEITCGSALPVNFFIKVQQPFSISQEQFSLLPGKSATLRVDFDPGQKLDRMSGEQLGKLQIIHSEHPHRESVELVGEVCFPNIKLDTNLINFGSILNDTSKKILISMDNVSEMPLYYEWTFVEEELVTNAIDQQSDKNSISSRNSIREKQTVPINEVFDILPLSGYLEPGENEQVEFVYNAFGGQRFKTTAVCHVEGGPQYECTLIGDSSLITYRLSSNLLELGDIRFCDWVSKDFFIENTGKVTFEYKILYITVKRKGYISCTPDYGRIIGGEKQKVTVKICPVMPDVFKEIIMVQVGYFEPEQIVVQGRGYYPAILSSLPRQENEVFKGKFDDQYEKKKQERENTLKTYQLLAKASEGQQSNKVAGVKSLEQIQADIEKEIDRSFYCEYIQGTLEKKETEKLLQTDRLDSRDGSHPHQLAPLEGAKQLNQTMNTTQMSKLHAGIETKLYEKIILSTYICDFGNVVIGKPRKMQFKIQNTGHTPIDLTFDGNAFRSKGFSLMPERITKLPIGDEATITVSYQAKKNVKFGKNEVIVPLEVRNGAKYYVKLLSNITIPEIFMENIEEFVDFGKVLCGQRKTVFVRLVNDKEIACDWKLIPLRDMLMDKKKEPPKFSMEPTFGSIPSGQKQIVQINFFPGYEKEYNHKFVLDIDQNPKQFPIQCKGTGTSINLEFEPNLAQIGPVLPYDQFSYCVVEVKNPTDYDTELFSIDFDKQYIKDEDILNNYQELDNNDQIFVPVRNPGEPIWPSIEKSVQKQQEIDEIMEKLNNPEQEQEISEEEKENLQKRLDELNRIEDRPVYPERVEEDLLHHVVLVGPPGCGKTDMALQMSEKDKRYVMNMGSFVDWCLENDRECAEKIREELEHLNTEKEKILEERAKLEKKAGKKAVELQEKWGPVNDAQFSYLSEDLLVEALKDRLSFPDCNAGIIVDGLDSKYYPDQRFGLKVLMRAVGNQALQLVYMAPQYDEKGLELWKLIEWEGMDPKPEEEAQPVQTQQSENPNKKGKKKGGKDLKVNTQEKKKQNQEKKEKKKKEIVIEEPPESPLLFDVYEPKQWPEEEAQQEVEEGQEPVLTDKQKYEQLLETLIKIMKNEFNEKFEVPALFDPVWDEGKKEEKKPAKKDAKKGGKEEEEPVEEVVPEVFDYTEALHQGKRIVDKIVFHYNKPQLFKTFTETVPAPVYPDPNTLPVPQPQYMQILQKPTKIIQGRKEIDQESITNKYYSILTPIENMYAPTPEQLREIELKKQQEEEERRRKEEEENQDQVNEQQVTEGDGQDQMLESNTQGQHSSVGHSKPGTAQSQRSKKQQQEEELSKMDDSKKSKKILKRPNRPAGGMVSSSRRGRKEKEEEIKEEEENQEPLPPKYTFERDQLSDDQSRWIIPAKRTLLLVVRFFTKTIGTFEGKLDFENFFSLKKYAVDLKSVADFPTISTLPKSIYWQVKKARPQTAPESYLSKVYVGQEKAFDFGPLLIGKNPDQKDEPEVKRINSVTFRISNQGKFDGKLEFSLMSTVMEDNPDYKKDIFFIEPKEIEIPKNDIPFELRVWAIPDEPRKFKDDIIIMIKDNPQPVILPIHCLGAKPVVDITEGEPVQFDRLLLKQSDTKQIKLKNNGFIPCKWKLTGLENLPEEFSLQNTFGELKPTEETIVEVNFKAIAQQKFNEEIMLEVEDVEGLGITQEAKPIQIEAEAFEITVEFKFPNDNEDNMLDFEAVRVGDIKDQFYTVKNNGLYNVKFSFAMKKKLFKDNFTIEPSELELEPQQEKQIMVRFCSQKEVKLNTQRHNTDIIMEILEGKTNEIFKPVPINVKVNAVFSKYSITPLKNMNFGAIQFNETKKLHFEIKNEGLFEFNYTIFDFKNEEFRKELMKQQEEEKEARLQAVLQKDQPQDKNKKAAKKDAKDSKKNAKKGGKNEDPQGLIRVGQWSINPSVGSIAADSSATIEIEFTGQSMKLYEEKLAIDVTGRDPEDSCRGIEYDVVGESCIPGINCDNFESIFEEQIIVPSQQSSNNIQNVVNSNVFFYEEKTFFFGTLVPQKHPDGICEKFKIMNPFKVPCTVKFDVRKRNPNSNENFAFEIGKKEAKIHPHEHTYVKVYFKPTIMAQYSGIFEAIVQNGEQNPKTYKLVFDLRGEGAMPTIKLEKPREYHNDSTPLLKFPKVRVGKSVTLPIILKNDGQVPATAKWDLNSNENFRFIDSNSFSLVPKTYAHFNIEFRPLEPGVKQWQIAVQTMHNAYELTRFMVQGEGFYEDVVFENLPKELEDEVDLGNCVINQEKKVFFAVKNNSNEGIRFNWNTQGCEDFSVVPRCGHLAGGSSTSLMLVFKSMKSVTHNKFNLLCETKRIKQANEDNFQEWNDAMTNVRYVTQTEYDWYMKRREEEELRRKEEEAAAANKKGAKKQDKKQGKKPEDAAQERPPTPPKGEDACVPYEEPIPEPEHSVVEKTEKNVALHVSAVADFARYEVDTREIFFAPTLMYTQRSYTFNVKNTSLIDMKYSCKIIQYEDNMPIVDPGYFYISPKQGAISPQCTESFEIKFQPTEIHQNNERFLIISIDDLEPNAEPLVIELDGEAERPICHFELPASNYREKKPDIDSSYNIIEFESLGTKVKNVKRFYTVNPTAQGYEFEWKRIDSDKLPPSANTQNEQFFRCITQKGVCLSGKKFEMIFEYTPDIVGVHESYWVFEIPELKLQQFFLIVGTVIEPNIFFDVGKVNFGPLLIGGKNKEIVHLKNLEEIPISFNLDKSSIFGEQDYANSLTVHPLTGTVKPHGDMPIEITFHPQVETEYNYNLLCNLKRKSRPVSLNVKGIGYILNHSVYFQNMPSALDSSVPHPLSFGDIYVNEKQTKTIQIHNKGEFNFDFSIKKSHNISFIQITPEHGTVKQNESFQIEVKFVPLAEYSLNKNRSQIQLQITSGPSYVFQLQGSARRPGVDFSYYTYDFGPCFVLRQPLAITSYLEVKNRDMGAMSIESNFEKESYLDVSLASGQVIMPLQIEHKKDQRGLVQSIEQNILKIPITFTPRECIKYDQVVSFDINNLHKIDVRIMGEGIPFKLELDKTEDSNVDFGVVRVNKDSTKMVAIVNYSRKPVNLTFDIGNQLEELRKMFINVLPLSDFCLQPKEKKEIEINFAPKLRLHQFRKELKYKIIENQEERKLLNINGTCHGIELKLMEDTIGFGMVVINSKKTQTVQLCNLGDIGAKFDWDTTYCKKYFTITPQRGYLPPQEDQFFQITFHPDVIDPDIRFNKVRCNIEGSDPFFINLLGKCIAQPQDSIQELNFNTIVRTPQVQKVQVRNPGNETCKIKVSISAYLAAYKDYFKGKPYLEIGPGQSAEYEITYNPLTMTENELVPEIKEKQHEGNLFFPLPDGTAIVYNLFGISNPPNPEQTFDISCKAKQTHVHIIPIKNWLKQSQRFKVSWTLEEEDDSIFISGANTFDVAAEAQKDYKLSLFGLKQTNSKITLKYINEKTNEFIHFKINLSVQAPDVQKKIELTSVVRETVSKVITIENPLNSVVEITKEMLTVDNDHVIFNPPSFSVPARSESGFEIVYRPLLAKEEQSKVILKSPELGEYTYPLQLKGVAPSTIQRSMAFKASLGSDIVQSFKFTNYCKKPTTYIARIDKVGTKPVAIDPKAKGGKEAAVQVDFQLEQAQQQVGAAETQDGNDVTFNIRFEPSNLGDSQAQLTIQSVEGGEYQCILNGMSTPPQPKGPFKMAGAKPEPIQFKNPFFEPQEFSIRIDNPNFTTSAKNQKLDGKKPLPIPIAYKPAGGSSNGRLIISIEKGNYPPWVFYL